MRVLIVEDEEIVAGRLARLVREILGPRLRWLRTVARFDDALREVRERSIDLLLLDLNLHGHDAFALLEEAAASAFATIVVSAHADQALRAFEYGVTDFVAKPYDRERLGKALTRVVDPGDVDGRARVLAVRRPGRILLVPVEEVDYVRGAGDYTEVHCRDGSQHLHDKSLNSLERLLPGSFVRVHRSWIVRVERIRELRSTGGGHHVAVLAEGAEVPVSRGSVGRLRERLRGA
jgi:two-component system response regulator LytT